MHVLSDRVWFQRLSFLHDFYFMSHVNLQKRRNKWLSELNNYNDKKFIFLSKNIFLFVNWKSVLQFHISIIYIRLWCRTLVKVPAHERLVKFSLFDNWFFLLKNLSFRAFTHQCHCFKKMLTFKKKFQFQNIFLKAWFLRKL